LKKRGGGMQSLKSLNRGDYVRGEKIIGVKDRGKRKGRARGKNCVAWGREKNRVMKRTLAESGGKKKERSGTPRRVGRA